MMWTGIHFANNRILCRYSGSYIATNNGAGLTAEMNNPHIGFQSLDPLIRSDIHHFLATVISQVEL